MRGLPGSWLHHMSKERRTAVISLAVLLVLLGTLVLYQRFTVLGDQIPEPKPAPDVPIERGTQVKQSPAEVDGLPVASDPGSAITASPPELTKLSRPLAGSPKVRMKFGQAHHLFDDFRMYTGIAFTAPLGEAVLAAGPGTVQMVEENPLDGRVVVVDHGHGLQTRYAGLGEVTVTSGAAVTTGAVIGRVGEPGPAWTELGSHLQLQVLVRGESVDPVSYFPN